MAEETKPYVFQEYPKSLYKGGERSGEHRVATDVESERAARADGFKMIDPKLDAESSGLPVAEAEAETPKAKGKK